MISIKLNGDEKCLAENTTLGQLVEQLSMQNQRYAIELNETIAPRSQHNRLLLKNNDKVEIVGAIGGG